MNDFMPIKRAKMYVRVIDTNRGKSIFGDQTAKAKRLNKKVDKRAC